MIVKKQAPGLVPVTCSRVPLANGVGDLRGIDTGQEQIVKIRCHCPEKNTITPSVASKNGDSSTKPF
jgi:hypothetical protein